MSDVPAEAAALARQLEQLNAERKEIEQRMQEEARALAELAAVQGAMRSGW